jgi:hypothetical protein
VVGLIIFNVEELQARLDTGGLAERPDDGGDHVPIVELEVALLILVVEDVDVGWVRVEVRVRVVPAHNLLARGKDLLV